MNAQQQRVLESFRRIQGWCQANQQYVTSEDVEGRTPLATQVRALNEVVDRVMDFVATQDTQLSQSMLVSKDEREQRREVLAHHMTPIAKVAKALRGQVPGIGVLTMPRGNVQTAALITAATVMARKAEVYAPVLVEQGLPTDFLAQLTTAAAKLKESLDARGLARGARASASRGLEAELALGRRLVTIMDVTLTRLLRREPAKIAEWRHVKRVMVRAGGSRVSPTGDEVQPIGIEGSPTRSEASPTVAEEAPTRSERVPTVSQLVPSGAQGESGVTNLSPTDGEASPIVGERAA